MKNELIKQIKFKKWLTKKIKLNQVNGIITLKKINKKLNRKKKKRKIKLKHN